MSNLNAVCEGPEPPAQWLTLPTLFFRMQFLCFDDEVNERELFTVSPNEVGDAQECGLNELIVPSEESVDGCMEEV